MKFIELNLMLIIFVACLNHTPLFAQNENKNEQMKINELTVYNIFSNLQLIKYNIVPNDPNNKYSCSISRFL